MKRCIAFFLAAALGITGGILLAVFFQITSVTDSSMMPGYEQGEHVLVRCGEVGSFGVERGDVVLFDNMIYAPTGEGKRMMKRVIGVEGDRVMITAGKVYVNNTLLEETYVFSQDVSGEMEEINVPEGWIFVLGDNRAASTDSRDETVGLIKETDLKGKVLYKW
ncbi:signal peptidase I [Ihubacter sp. rT4E-8]|uniref:signal peptidase I n=1 Tax=unclassified Ihubacter TaxID=2633299 RepID=UPI003C7A63B9